MKNLVSPSVVRVMAHEISNVFDSFDQKEFMKVSSKLSSLELKARVRVISESLKDQLPDHYPDALKIILKVVQTKKLEGFALWPFSEYIAQYGLKHFDLSMNAMYQLTEHFSSEFAIRPFF